MAVCASTSRHRHDAFDVDDDFDAIDEFYLSKRQEEELGLDIVSFGSPEFAEFSNAYRVHMLSTNAFLTVIPPLRVQKAYTKWQAMQLLHRKNANTNSNANSANSNNTNGLTKEHNTATGDSVSTKEAAVCAAALKKMKKKW